MKNFILALVVALSFALPAAAQSTISASGLTDVQRAEIELKIKKQIEENNTAKKQAVATPAETVQQYAAYADIGASIGKSVASAAREMGVAVNDFANTNVGQLATFIIVWKLIGHDFIRMGVGILFLIAWVPIWLYMLRRMTMIAQVTLNPVNDKDGNPTRFNTKTITYREPSDRISSTRLWLVITFIVILVIDLLFTFV